MKVVKTTKTYYIYVWKYHRITNGVGEMPQWLRLLAALSED